jgi:hypothetical protein
MNKPVIVLANQNMRVDEEEGEAVRAREPLGVAVVAARGAGDD